MTSLKYGGDTQKLVEICKFSKFVVFSEQTNKQKMTQILFLGLQKVRV